MRVVTTCHAAGFEQYGFRMLESWARWPVGSELWWYTEGFHLPSDRPAGIVEVDVRALAELERFKATHGHYIAPNYLYDAVRFSNKVFAAADALSDYEGVGVWMDADCVTLQDIPAGHVEGMLQGADMAMFKRAGMYTETGFWVMDRKRPITRELLQAWCEWYTSGQYKTLDNWTDCETLDATVRLMERAEVLRTVSLSGAFERDMHPMSKAPIARFLDHCKGQRKALGYSPERVA